MHQQYLSEHPIRYPTAVFYLFLYQTRTVWQRPQVTARTAPVLIYNIRWAKLYIFSCNTSNQTTIRHSKLVLWRKTNTQSNVVIKRKNMKVPKVPKAGSMTMVLLCLIGQQTRPTWTPTIVKRKMRDTRPNNADDLKATIKVSWASLHMSSATGWLSSCHIALME